MLIPIYVAIYVAPLINGVSLETEINSKQHISHNSESLVVVSSVPALY